jgi:formyltetrahydrofolate-dependent phosphoribosylglycinamide formyltransferase
MLALIRACQSGRVPAEIEVVIAPSTEAPALVVASDLRVPTAVVAPGDGYGERLLAALDGCDWLCLAGFMRLLPTEVLDAFPGRVLNIHPALLPKFGGKGMYGKRVHEAVLEAGETESGCTIHLVTPVYDEGPIVLQKKCAVLPDDTPETLAARVLEVEHAAYPEALARVVRGA